MPEAARVLVGGSQQSKHSEGGTTSASRPP